MTASTRPGRLGAWVVWAVAAARAKPVAEKLDPAVIRTALILVVGGLAVVFD